MNVQPFRDGRARTYAETERDDLDWTVISLVLVLVLVLAALSAVLLVLLWRAHAVRPDGMGAKQLEGHLDSLFNLMAAAQSKLAESVNKRLDDVSFHLGESLDKNNQATTTSLTNLAERLAVIDRAQNDIASLAGQMTSLQNVLANKQSRGAFGQGRMETIVRDNLPQGAFKFQATLSNGLQPDCVISMPDKRPLVIDAKFPLENVTAYRGAKTDTDRKAAEQRVRADVGKHIDDIAAKYLLQGETQDIALMFVPSEAVYAELHESFDGLVQRAYRKRIFIVSPTILMLAIQVVEQIERDARMRERADQIRDEVVRLLEDVGRLGDRVRKLQAHFGQSTEDIRQAMISIEKIEARGENIRRVEVTPPSAAIEAAIEAALDLPLTE
jgi:DNA recombination protein RmuC